MPVQWKKTKHVGVRFYEHPTRKHGVNFDRYYAIRYTWNGKRYEEGLGWTSETWTAQEAALELADLKKNQTTGEGPPTMAEKRKSKQARRDKEQAEAERLEKESVTFSDFFDETYFPTAKVGKSAGSLKAEGILHKKWLKPVIGALPFREIAPFHFERIKKNMVEAKRRPRSLEYAFAVARQVWNMARRDGLTDKACPTGEVKKLRIDNKRMRFLTHEEADALLIDLSTRSQQLHDMALLALHCGLRAGEIFDLTWGDVDTGRGLLTLRDTKSGKNRMAYMTGEVKKMFEQMGSGEQNELVFKVRRKALLKAGEVRVKQISNSFDQAVAGLGFNKGVTDRRQKAVFHTLRHTFASWLVEAGTDLYTVKELMGHGTLAMTERYSHLSENTCRAAVRNLEDAVSRSKPKVVALGKKRKKRSAARLDQTPGKLGA